MRVEGQSFGAKGFSLGENDLGFRVGISGFRIRGLG
jgi:hypothetical protein